MTAVKNCWQMGWVYYLGPGKVAAGPKPGEPGFRIVAAACDRCGMQKDVDSETVYARESLMETVVHRYCGGAMRFATEPVEALP